MISRSPDRQAGAFSVFGFRFSVFSFQFSVLSFQFSVFGARFSVFGAQFLGCVWWWEGVAGAVGAGGRGAWVLINRTVFLKNRLG